MSSVTIFTGYTPPPGPPDPGPYVPSRPLSAGVKSTQFIRGFKFGNVPGGRAEFAKGTNDPGATVFHVNTVSSVVFVSSDKSEMSGVVRFRFRDNSSNPVTPASVLKNETRNVDQFGNVIFR